MTRKSISRKELNRYSKSQLLKICRDNGFDCKKTMLKSELVNKIMKNKAVREKLSVPEKRKPSAKQQAARERFKKMVAEKKMKKQDERISLPEVPVVEPQPPKPTPNQASGSTKSQVIIDPTSSNKAAPPVIQPPKYCPKVECQQKVKIEATETPMRKLPIDMPPREPNQIKGKVPVIEEEKREKTVGSLYKTDYKYAHIIKPKYRQHATSLLREFNEPVHYYHFGRDARPTHIEEIKDQMTKHANELVVGLRENIASNRKTTDALDRRLFNGITLENKRQLFQSINKARYNHLQDFSGGDSEMGAVEANMEQQTDTLGLITELLLDRADQTNTLGHTENHLQQQIGEPEVSAAVPEQIAEVNMEEGVVEETEEKEEPQVDTDEFRGLRASLNRMNKEQLLTIGKDNGIVGRHRMLKTELIEAIVEVEKRRKMEETQTPEEPNQQATRDQLLAQIEQSIE